MPKKRGKKRAPPRDRINITVRQSVSQRQAPDFIQPLKQRPRDAFDVGNQMRLTNPPVTYISAPPLSSMPSIRDIVGAQPAPQVSGQPAALRPNIVPVETNPRDIEPRDASRVAIGPNPVTPAGLLAGYAAQDRLVIAQSLRDESMANLARLRNASQQFVPGPLAPAPSPIIGQRLEPAQADESQRLVANAAEPDEALRAVPRAGVPRAGRPLRWDLVPIPGGDPDVFMMERRRKGAAKGAAEP
jgi:hypothetical protein